MAKDVRKTYTPEQTYNYKSDWVRYQKGQKIAEFARGNIFQDRVNPTIYKVLSKNAPKGYWTVTRGGAVNFSVVKTAQFLGIPSNPTPGSTSQRINNQGGVVTIIYDYAADISGNIVTSRISNIGTLSGPGATPNDLNTFTCRITVQLIPNVGAVINNIKGVLSWTTTASRNGVYEDDPDAGIITSQNIAFGGNNSTRTGEPAYSSGAFPETLTTSFLYTHQFTTDINLQTAGSFSALLAEQLLITEVNGQPIGLTCDCPDSSKEELLSTNAKLFPRQWKSSDAGAKNGQCKHIWAIRIINKDVPNNEIPSDVPIGYSGNPGNV